MLDINMADVMNILSLCIPYLIGFAVVLVVAVIAIIICKKKEKHTKFLVRRQALVAIMLALVIVANLICFGPMSTMLTLATGDGIITEETSAKAENLVQEIAEEGTVLLKNDGNLLPLENSNQLNVFGWSSTNPCYGGVGSGALSDSYPVVSLEEGLTNAGFELNQELSEFYKEYRAERPEVTMFSQDWTLPEPPVNTYNDEMTQNAKDFSDVAMIVVTRVGGECADVPTDMNSITYTDNSTEYADFEEGGHYLELSQSEKNLVDMVCANFENVIFVYNGASVFELGFLNEYEQIKSAIWCPGAGQNGFNALGNILNGSVNPSGKLVDTYVADLMNTPTVNNFGNFTYDNMNEFQTGDHPFFPGTYYPTFVNYVEGIYVGYRYYETAAEEGFINYDEAVVYPFGHGLSYTSFTQEIQNTTIGEDNITFDVLVTNTGNRSGKDVVEIYYTPPYYNGGIEKSSVNLLDFDKTEELAPGESEVVTISFNVEDMASYDTYGEGCYVLEAGNYDISLQANAHEAIDSFTYEVTEPIVYDENNKRSTDLTAAVNQFAEAEGTVEYLSRADHFANYETATAAPESMTMPEEQKAAFINNSNYNPEEFNNSEDEMPVTEAKNGLSLVDLRGKDYDDPMWEDLLDQLTISDMNEMIAIAGYMTSAAPSVDKVQTLDCDGPASINNNFTGVGSVGFPSGVMVAATWNIDMAQAFGENIGEMADEMDVSGWYAPAMNNHRSAFAGRNFEYYSEDGVLAGKVAANAVIGAEKYGVYGYIKHFVLNDQETNRQSMLCTWCNEQALREIYMKPFEIAVKEGKAKAVMSAYNYIGTVWAAGSNALLNTVLRDEWGFQGMVETDYFIGNGFMNSDQAIRNGNDICLVAYDAKTNYVSDTKSATSVQAMRQASKNLLYTVVNSRAYSEGAINTGLHSWQIAAIIIDVVLAILFALAEIVVIKKYMTKRKEAIPVITVENE